MLHSLLLVACIAVPIAAAVMELYVNSRLSERHHSHHDTYSMPTVIFSVLVIAMVFMGVLGCLLVWLCHMHVFNADETVMLSFFASFEIVMFVMWYVMRRYNVSTYADHMEVTPFVGKTRSIKYEDIEHLRWSGSKPPATDRSISVIVDGKIAATILGSLDIEQILLSINRDDILD